MSEAVPSGSEGPLSGIRVLDMTIWVQGPLASTLLADLGADVIKIEPAGRGDPLRNMTAVSGRDQQSTSGANVAWSVCNRNKRSLTLDLKKPAAQKALHKLVEQSDVFVTNVRRSALRQLGADDETIRTVNPRIVYARGGGFGDAGPLAEDPCQDTTGMAYSGFMFTCSSSAGEPYYPPGALTDVVSATALASGVLAALVDRARTGQGHLVTTSQLQAMMWVQTLSIATAANLRTPFLPTNRQAPPNPLFNTYRAGDGQWIALGLALEGHWPPFLEAVELEHLRDDPRFASSALRADNAQELTQLLERHLAEEPAEHWLGRMRDRDLWVAPVRTVEDLVGDPQVMANQLIVELDDGLQVPAPPFFIEGFRTATKPFPEYGAHSDEVLASVGYSEQEILDLRTAGAVW